MARYVITGGLGVGKTTLMESLGNRFETVPEPARALISEHRNATGERDLDSRPELFVTRLVARSVEAYGSAEGGSVALFDRGVPDCVAYADVLGVDRQQALEAASMYRFESLVFVAPPWREIYRTDDMRRATFKQAEAFHAAVVAVYLDLGYDMVELPKSSVDDRVAFVRARLELAGSSLG